MSKNNIEVGDTVDVEYGGGQYATHMATVLHIAVATGDAWRFREQDGHLVYIQSYVSITRRDNKEEG